MQPITIVTKGAAVTDTNALPVKAAGGVTMAHTEAAIATATTAALAANANRRYALFVNDSDTVIYLKIGGNGELNKGIRLNANGGSFEMSHNLGNLDARVVNGIHGGAATKNLLVMEGV